MSELALTMDELEKKRLGNQGGVVTIDPSRPAQLGSADLNLPISDMPIQPNEMSPSEASAMDSGTSLFQDQNMTAGFGDDPNTTIPTVGLLGAGATKIADDALLKQRAKIFEQTRRGAGGKFISGGPVGRAEALKVLGKNALTQGGRLASAGRALSGPIGLGLAAVDLGSQAVFGDTVSGKAGEITGDLIARGMGLGGRADQARAGLYSNLDENTAPLGGELLVDKEARLAKEAEDQRIIDEGTLASEMGAIETTEGPMGSMFPSTSELGSPELRRGEEGSPQENFARTLDDIQAGTRGPLSPMEIQQAQIFAGSMGRSFDPRTGYGETGSAPLIPRDVAATQQSLLRQFGAPTIREIMAQPGTSQAPSLSALDSRNLPATSLDGGITRNLPASPLDGGVTRNLPASPLDGGITRNLPATSVSPEMISDLVKRDQLPSLSSFEKASQDRIARMDASPDFMKAQPARMTAQPASVDSRTSSQLSKGEMRDLITGQQPGATIGQQTRAMEIMQRAGMGEFDKTSEQLQQERLELSKRADERAQVGLGLEQEAAKRAQDKYDNDLLESKRKAQRELELEPLEDEKIAADIARIKAATDSYKARAKSERSRLVGDVLISESGIIYQMTESGDQAFLGQIGAKKGTPGFDFIQKELNAKEGGTYQGSTRTPNAKQVNELNKNPNRIVNSETGETAIQAFERAFGAGSSDRYLEE